MSCCSSPKVFFSINKAMILLTCFGDLFGQESSTTSTVHTRANTCSIHETQGVGGNGAQLVDKSVNIKIKWQRSRLQPDKKGKKKFKTKWQLSRLLSCSVNN